MTSALKLGILALRWGSLSVIGMGGYQRASCDGKVPSADTKGAGCGDPVCQSTSDMFSKALKMQKGKESATTLRAKQCPLNRDEIGRSTWDVIHTIAAHFPESPDSAQKDAALLFMASLALLYPCSICAPDFQEFVQKNPPRFEKLFTFCIISNVVLFVRVETREEFVLWCCELHNHINEKLGKATTTCNVASMDALWKTASPECKLDGRSDLHDHHSS